MHDTDTIPELDRAGLRQFGIVTGVIFVMLFGLFLPWLLDHGYPRWPWAVFLLLAAFAVAAPSWLRPVYRVWMRIGLMLSKITTPLIMAIVFFAVITPTALLMKLIRRDAMKRRFDQSASYRTVREPIRVDSLEHPY